MADTKTVSEEETSMEAASSQEQQQHESIDEMLARHRQEIKQLQNKETEMKKAAAKGSKAEQKAKKKQVEEDISKLSTKLKEKQLQELSTQGFSSTSNQEKPKEDIETLVRAIAGVAVQEHAKQPSKSVKRREKRFKEEAEREQRIKQEQIKIKTQGGGTDRMIENENLEKKLRPLGLTIHEIKPDGHCLYRAVENQLSGQYSYKKLREMAGSYMRDHKSDFIPFLELKSSDSDVEERFEKYCKDVETTAAWGGQLEIEALTHCLKKHVMVFSGSFPDVEMGKEYKSGDGDGSRSIMLSYHRYAFGLGEHYNSVVLLQDNITG